MEQEITLHTKVILSENKTKRFLVEKKFDKLGRSILVIMLKATGGGEIEYDDKTMHYLLNNLSKLGYSTIKVWNIVPDIQTDCSTKEMDEMNMDILKQTLTEPLDNILIGWGAKKMASYIEKFEEIIRDILKPYSSKLVTIKDLDGRYKGNYIHPLFAGNYFSGKWVLKNLNTEVGEDKRENNNKGRRNKSVTENGLDKFKNKLKDDGNSTDS